MPDLLRTFGDLLGSRNESARTWFVLVGIVTLLLVVFTVGSVTQAIVRRLKRWQRGKSG